MAGGVVAGDVAQARRELAGALTHGEAVQHQVREETGLGQRSREAGSFEHPVGGEVEFRLQRTVGHGTLGEPQGLGGGNAVFQQHGEDLRKVEQGGLEHEFPNEEGLHQPGVGGASAGLGLPPAPEGDAGDNGDRDHNHAIVHHELGTAHDDARGERELAAE